MTVRVSHIAMAGPQMEKVAAQLAALGLEIEHTHDVPTEKVKAAMMPVEVSPSLRIELLEPTSPDSPIAKFLQKRVDGGLHHLCFEVKDLEAWEKRVKERGLAVLPPGIRKAARGRAFFLHPKCMGGVLVELEEISQPAKES